MQFTTTVPASLIDEQIKKSSYDDIIKFLSQHSMTEWLDFPYQSIEHFNTKIKPIDLSVDYIISIGVGGSCHGLEMICSFFKQHKRWIFLGTSFDAIDILHIKERIKGKKIGVNIVSKTGSTLEVKLFLDLFDKEIQKASFINIVSSSYEFYDQLLKYYPKDLCHRFMIEEKTGGRFSLVGEMGLLGIFLCGQNIKEFIETLKQKLEYWKTNYEQSFFMKRGVSRYLLQKELHITIESLSTNTKDLFHCFNWAAQLMAESDGKNQKGLYITKTFYPQDAHSIGQIFNDGNPTLSETFYTLKNFSVDLPLENNKISKIQVQSLNQVSQYFIESIKEERIERGMYVSHFLLEERSTKELAELIITEMVAICIESYFLKVNPFNQPGVESYKKRVKKKLL